MGNSMLCRGMVVEKINETSMLGMKFQHAALTFSIAERPAVVVFGKDKAVKKDMQGNLDKPWHVDYDINVCTISI